MAECSQLQFEVPLSVLRYAYAVTNETERPSDLQDPHTTAQRRQEGGARGGWTIEQDGSKQAQESVPDRSSWCPGASGENGIMIYHLEIRNFPFRHLYRVSQDGNGRTILR